MEEKKAEVLLGFIPIGKFCFSHEDAIKQKNKTEEALKELGVSYFNVDEVVEDGIVRSDEDAEKVVRYIRGLPREDQPDALFLPHCNFGTETAVGILGRDFRKPLLLWGPRDEAPLPDGARLRDSLCGVFASSKVLQNSSVPFTHLTNCRVEDPVFKEGIDRFIRAAAVVKRFTGGLRIGILGNRLPFFQCTMVNEKELLEAFGITVVPVNLLKVVSKIKERETSGSAKYAAEVKELSKHVDLFEMTEDAMIRVLAFRDVLLDIAEEERLDGLTVENIIELTKEMDTHLVFALASVTEKGIPAVIESDIHGVISSIIAQSADLNETPTFFMDLTVRHPEEEDAVLLWHNSAPLSLMDREFYAPEDNSGHPASGTASSGASPPQRPSIGSHWTMPGINPGVCNWKLKEGEVTVLRFERGREGYRLLSFDASSIPGPFNRNTYLWVGVYNWDSLEKKIIYGPYLHHVACVYGSYASVLEEACRYIPGLESDTLNT